METVLGLSLTPTTFGWVLAEGHGADGTILDHQETALRAEQGVPAVSTADQVAQEVLRVDAQAGAGEHRLRVIGVTWNDAAAAQAALLVEALTDAGFDNVVPVRLLDAVETLALAIAPVIGYDQTAVCLLEHERATVVMIDSHVDETRTVIKHISGGFDGLRSWLTKMFDRSGWRPQAVVVVGADSDIDGFSWQLEKALPVPVFAQTMAQVTVARGAALAAARSTEFTDEQLIACTADPAPEAPPRPGRLSYAGAAAALATGVVTFVSSLAMAVGIQFAPAAGQAPGKDQAHRTTPQVAEAGRPAVAPPPSVEPSVPRPAAGEPVSRQDAPAPESGEQQREANEPQPYLTRVLEHIPGDTGEPAPPPEPAQP